MTMNFFSKTDKDGNSTTAGGTTEKGERINLPISISDDDTGAHEMGRTLGINGHQAQGIMTERSNMARRSRTINSNTVSRIINNGFNGKSQATGNVQHNGTVPKRINKGAVKIKE